MTEDTVKPGICTGCPLYEEKMMPQNMQRSPDIAVLGDFPKPFDMKKGAFSSKGFNIIRSMFTKLDKNLPRDKQPSRDFIYAVRCCPEEYGFKLKAEIYDQCNPHLKMFLDRSGPKVIIAMGTEALRSLGIKGTANNLRGGMYSYKYEGGSAVVIPTYAAFQMTKQPGLVPVVENDVRKAYLLADEGLNKDTLDIRTPQTTTEILDELRELKAYIEDRYKKSGKPIGIGIDTEATGVHPFDPRQRLIALSLSWDDTSALAFPFGHQYIPQTRREMARIKKAVEETLDPDKVSLLMHNAKFDYQYLTLKYDFALPFPTYDTMLAEHCLEEDKKGEYSLKAATKDYLPALGMYEDELQQALADINKERQEKYKEHLAQAKKEISRVLLDHWLELSEQERMRYCARWIEKGYKLGDYNSLIKVQTRKYKGEIVVLKKYKAAVEKMLKRITPEDLGVELPEYDIEEPADATFEDLEPGMMLEYAAMDALVTRLITKKQLARFSTDDEIIRSTEKRIGAKLPTQSLRAGLYDLTMPLCESVARMEYGGVCIDRDRANQYVEQLTKTKEELEEKLFNHVGYKFDTSSSSGDLRRILFEEMGYPPLKISEKTGEPSTDAETLKELYDKYDDEFLTTLQSHRKIDKCISTYLLSWLARSELDGRIHCQFNQIGTATHRLSSSKPNLGHVLEVVKPREFREHLTG